MKIPIIKHRKNVHGSVLVIGLVIASILGVTLASYLVLTQNQHRAMVRSATWGTSLSLSEAGVEEALALINKYAGTSTELSTWTNSAGPDGWTRDGIVFSKTRTMDSAIGSYTVYITNLLDAFNLPNRPAIYAEGNAVWNVVDSSLLKPYYAAAGVQSESTPSASAPVVRRVAVQTIRTPLFPVPKAAIGQINLQGNNIATDSFDSSLPAYSIDGKYPTGNPSMTRDKGTVITLSTLIDSLNVGNADIKGMVKTGPNGTIAIGPNGSVGSKAWVEGGNNGIQTGYSADDVNLDFPNAVLPSVPSWTALPSLPAIAPVIGVTTYDLVLTTGNYIASSLPDRIYVAPGQQVIVRVTGSVHLSGTDRIDISTNASMAVYMGATSGAAVSFSTQGNGNINNVDQNALNFQLYGLPTCTSISMGGNASFTGTIYAPQADLTWGGGGSTTYDFVGASVAKTDTMNGHANFHYDENLGKRGPSRGYVPNSWAEK